MKFKLYPYSIVSQSAKALAQALDCKRVKPNGNYRPKETHIIINWGNSQYPLWGFISGRVTPPGDKWLNLPINVNIACNKLLTFQTLKEANVSTPDWTTELITAKQWKEDGYTIFGRKTLKGHSGQGIVIYKPEERETIWTICPLYTKYTKCKHEYRVHVMNENIIDFTQKKKRENTEVFNQYIRSYSNGWVFCREEVELPECIKQAALRAIQALGLDFGAVDIGYNTREDKAYVYEVNTAPALEGTTLLRYTQAFKENYLDD